MATLDIVETDLFFALRPEQPGQSKWWRYDETSSGSEYLLESRYTDGSNGRLEAKLTGGGHELVNIFNIAQVDHPPRPPENRPWQYTWVSTRQDNVVFKWGGGLVIPPSGSRVRTTPAFRQRQTKQTLRPESTSR